MRHRYIKQPTTIVIDKGVVEELKKLKLHRGEPLGEVVRRILREHRVRSLVGY